MSIIKEIEKEAAQNAYGTNNALNEFSKLERLWDIEEEIDKTRKILSEKLSDSSICFKLHKLIIEKDEIISTLQE